MLQLLKVHNNAALQLEPPPFSSNAQPSEFFKLLQDNHLCEMKLATYKSDFKGIQGLISQMSPRCGSNEVTLDVPVGKGGVLESLNRHWDGLSVFVDHPEVPMDNNGSERTLHIAKLIVKNSYGCMSDWSVQLTETLLSIFATLQLWKINPRIWLTDYLQACAENHGKVPENSNTFLPWQMKPERLKYFQPPTSQAFDSS